MQELFAPPAVALIGISRQTGVGAYNGLEMLLRFGYQGRIYVVHPQATEILGQRVYPRVEDLPEVPPVAVISVGRDRVLPVVEECGRFGIRWLVIISQGFADADTQGKQLQVKLVALARQFGSRIVGPNTMGVMNAFHRFTTAFVDLECPPRPAPVTLIAQSGAPQVGAESFVGALGKAIDLGNAADVGFAEVLEYLEGDPETEVIALHLEGLRDGRRFLEVAARINRQKPVVVLKTGTSAAGAKAALSHTGSLVGEDQVFTAACSRAGLLRVASTLDWQDTIQACRKLPPLRGRRIGIATPSGALGIMAVDALEREGLEPGPLPEAVLQVVEPQGPYWHALHNPVDLWPIGMVSGDFLKVAGETLAAFLADPRIDGVLCLLPALKSPLHANLLADRSFFARLELERWQKPLVVSLYGDGREKLRQELEQVPGVACYYSVEQAVRALGQLYRRFRALSRPPETFLLPSPLAGRGSRPQKLLLGQAALDFLAAWGIPAVPGRLVKDSEAAGQAAETFGFPVVLKLISPRWLHKTEGGGVVLNLQNQADLLQAWSRLLALLGPEGLGEDEGVLVQRQLSGRELLLGLKRDPIFGPVLACGYGGIYTELWQDVAQTLVPVTPEQARELLSSLKSYRLLTGWRGAPAVALEAIVKAMVALSELALAHPELQELDLNPLLATPEGCWAVDARIVWS